MLDSDLAELYGVQTGALVRAVKRNIDRFPEDFSFQLSGPEFDNLRSQIGTSSQWGGRRYSPFAFTEQGVAMLSSVLRGERAAAVNVLNHAYFCKAPRSPSHTPRFGAQGRGTRPANRRSVQCRAEAPGSA